MFRSLATIAAFVLACFMLPASAAAANPLSDREQLTEDLVAIYDTKLIRERRIADDRVLSALETGEQEIRKLRREKTELQRQLAASNANKSALQKSLVQVGIELERVRESHNRLAKATTARDAEVAVEREAFRAEAVQIVSKATPDQLAALRLFADGERVTAFPIIERLNEASIRASKAATDIRVAPLARQTAQLAGVMHIKGEKPLREVLRLWRRAAELDPNDFGTQVQIRRTAELEGQTSLALEAAQAAYRLADLPERKSMAAIELGDALRWHGRSKEALAVFLEALAYERSLASNKGELVYTYNLSVSLKKVCDAYRWNGQLKRALGYCEEALQASRAMLAFEPTTTNARDLSVSLKLMARLKKELGEVPAATVAIEESILIDRSLKAQGLDQAVDRRDLPQAMLILADLKAGPEALDLITVALDEYRALLKLDPRNATAKRDVSVALKYLNAFYLKAGSPDRSLSSIEEAVAIDRELVALDIRNNENRYDLFLGLGHLYETLVKTSEWSRAQGVFREAILTIKPLLLTRAISVHSQGEASEALADWGHVALNIGDHENASMALGLSVETRRTILEASSSPITDLRLVQALIGFAQARVEMAQLTDASKNAAEATSIIRQALKLSTNNIPMRKLLVEVTLLQGRIALALGEHDAGIKNLLGARTALKSLEWPDPTIQDLSFRIRFNAEIGNALDQNQQHEEGLAAYDDVVRDVQALLQKDPQHPLVGELPAIERTRAFIRSHVVASH